MNYNFNFEKIFFKDNSNSVIKEVVKFIKNIEKTIDFSFKEERIPFKPTKISIDNIMNSKLKNLGIDSLEVYSIKVSEISPYDLLDKNLGEKRDLDEVFKFFLKKFRNQNTYAIFKADIAIFMPFYKYLLANNSTINFKPLFIFLGFWHVFKILVERIFYEHFYYLWWRFSISLYGNQTQLKKPKLNYILSFLFNIQIQFENVVDQYEELLQNENLSHHSTCANIYHLFKKTLPKIKNFYMSLKLNNFPLFEYCLKEILVEYLATTSHNYIKAITLQLLIFEYLKKKKHELYKEFLLKEFSSCIEESNETQLSFFSSSNPRELGNHEIMKEKYLLLPEYYKMSNSINKKNNYFQKLNFGKNNKIINCFKEILKELKENKFYYLNLNNWKIFYPNNSYEKIEKSIGYKFDDEILKKNFLKNYDSLYRIFENPDFAINEFVFDDEDDDFEEEN